MCSPVLGVYGATGIPPAAEGHGDRLVPARRRCSRGRPAMGTSRICAARPCRAQGVVVFAWRCSVAANRRSQRQRRRRSARLQHRQRGAQVAFRCRLAQGRGAARAQGEAHRLNRGRTAWRVPPGPRGVEAPDSGGVPAAAGVNRCLGPDGLRAGRSGLRPGCGSDGLKRAESARLLGCGLRT
jgi:hypothetical protein